MDNRHLTNSLHFTYRKVVELEAAVTNRGQTVDRNNPGTYRAVVPAYYCNKLMELGSESITRGLLDVPRTVTHAQLMEAIRPLNDEAVASRARWRAANGIPEPVPGARPATGTVAGPGRILTSTQATVSRSGNVVRMTPNPSTEMLRESAPPAVLSVYLNTINTTNALIHNQEVLARRKTVRAERNLSFEL